MNSTLDDHLSAAAGRLQAAAEQLEVPELPEPEPRRTALLAAAALIIGVAITVAGVALLGGDGADTQPVISGPDPTSTPSTTAASAPSTTSTTASTTTTTTVDPNLDAEQVLANYLAGNPDIIVTTPVLEVGGRLVALVGRDVDGGAAVTVLDLTGGTASTITEFTAPDQRFTTAFPVQTGDVTGDGEDDVLLPLDAASAGIGMVASSENGQWHLVRSDPGGGASADGVVFAREPRFEKGRLVTTYNDCVPSCAAGTQTDAAWVYVRADDVFRTADS